MNQANWIKEKWPHEAHDFTPWLKNNLKLVSTATGLVLNQLGREVAAAGGRADIVAWDSKNSAKVVIENQIESANARHFQQLMAYGESLEAKIRIWIAASFSDKFVRLADSENKKEEAVYYLLKIDQQTDGSSPIIFSPILAPTQSQLEKIFLTHDEINTRKRLTKEFWNQWGGRTVNHFRISRHARLQIIRSISASEAQIVVAAWCFKGIGRQECIRHVNSYAKKLAAEFPDTCVNPKWNFDEVNRNILKVTRQIDLFKLSSWAQIREWYSEVESRIMKAE